MRYRQNDGRILIYSHDTFGLGHLRRCRAIAHSLVESFKQLSVLILSGSPIIGSFDFRARVDFVRVPGVIKLRNGEYTSLNLHLDIRETMSMRASIIQHTAEEFAPDVFIVDKEPVGLRGELLQTLKVLKRRGTRLILGLRDVMDEPRLLEPEWQRKKVVPALREFYDEIWVYGLPQICDPLEGISLPESVRKRMVYTGYLHREVPTHGAPPRLPEIAGKPFLLVTTGGGGDGESLIDWVLRAYEHDPLLPYPALLVLGPFMQAERQAEFMDRAANRAAAGTVHPRLARRRARPDQHAERRWSLRSGGDGRGAARAAASKPSVGGRGARPARRAAQRLEAGRPLDRAGSGRSGAQDLAHRLDIAGRFRSERVSAPLRDLHRPGDRGARAPRSGHPHRFAAPCDRRAAPSGARRDPRPGPVSARVFASRARQS